ncbi:tetratricopeptide repeat protein, partial [Pseudoalteromonas sp. SIMBA_148]
MYQKAAKLGSSHAMNNLGLLAKQAGRTEEAISLYQQAISAGSDVSLLNLGRLYQEIGEYTKSEEILT